jgi:hypothetical protein
MRIEKHREWYCKGKPLKAATKKRERGEGEEREV